MGGCWRAQGRLYGGLGGESLVEIERSGGRVDGGFGGAHGRLDGGLDGWGSGWRGLNGLRDGFTKPKPNRTARRTAASRANRNRVKTHLRNRNEPERNAALLNLVVQYSRRA